MSGSALSDIPWGRFEIARTLLVAYLIVPVIALNAMALWAPTLNETAMLITRQIITLTVWAALFWHLQHQFPCDLLRIFGLKPAHTWGTMIKQSVLAIIAVVVVVLLMEWVLSITTSASSEPPDPYAHLSPKEIQMMVVFGIITAPILEEIVFRGFLQTSLTKYYRPWAAVVLTALVFTGLHQLYLDAPLAMAATFTLGCLLGYVRLKCESLIPCIAAHLFNNVLASLSLGII